MIEEPRTVWDNIADVMSGRVQNTLQILNKQILALKAELQEIKIIMADKTANEQALLDAATRINDSADSIRTSIETLKDKVATLQQQAASATAFQPEDLSEEFQTLNAALSNLSSAGATVAESAPAPVDVPNVQGQPITAPADASPLAGESGTTNPVVEGSGPLIDQQAPGVTTPGEAPTPDVEAPVDPVASGDAGTPNIDTLEGGAQGGASGEGLWAGDNNEQVSGDDTGGTKEPTPGPFDA